MRKALTYSSFTVASLLVVLMFMTAGSYLQLGIAVILYPLLIFFAYKIFLDKGIKIAAPVTIVKEPQLEPSETPVVNESTGSEKVIADIDKRAFLKLIGATGLSYFLFSLLGRRVEPVLFGQSGGFNTSLLGDPNQSKALTPNPTEDYRISEIDDIGITSYYGFTRVDGSWFIMRGEQETGSYRYVKGDSDFSVNWERRDKLNYDYFHKTF